MKTDWLPVPRARRKILVLQAVFAAFLTLLLLVQTATHKFGADVLSVWAWLGAVVGPPILATAASAILHRRGAKFLHPAVFQTLFWATLGYFLAVASAYFLTQVWMDSGGEPIEYLSRSLRFLGPISALLLAGVWAVFYRKESLFQPNSTEITRQAAEKAALASYKNELDRAAFFALVADGKLAEAAAALQILMQKKGEDSPILTVLKSQLVELQRAQNEQTADLASVQIQLNRIAVGLLALADL